MTQTVKDGTSITADAITSLGVHAVVGALDSQKATVAVLRRVDDQPDPIGTIGYLALRTSATTETGIIRIPRKIEGTDFTLPTLAVGEQYNVAPDGFLPYGQVCVVIGTYVAPVIPEVLQ